MSDLVVQLQALTDDELLEVVRSATEGRPALAAVHDAAVVHSAVVHPAEPVVAEAVPAQVQPGPSSPGVLPATHLPDADYTTGGVPTFGRVREKIEQRFGTSVGAGELDQDTAAGKSLQEQWDAREKAGHDRLEQIRRSMKKPEEQPKGNE
jgi:hypothetical protein